MHAKFYFIFKYLFKFSVIKINTSHKKCFKFIKRIQLFSESLKIYAIDDAQLSKPIREQNIYVRHCQI